LSPRRAFPPACDVRLAASGWWLFENRFDRLLEESSDSERKGEGRIVLAVLDRIDRLTGNGEPLA
jgi:hypothetical protein